MIQRSQSCPENSSALLEKRWQVLEQSRAEVMTELADEISGPPILISGRSLDTTETRQKDMLHYQY